MLRRTYIRLFAGAMALWRGRAVSAATLDRPQLQALAEAVLPESLGPGAIAKIAQGFDEWVAGYRPGAEMEHGYGITRMAAKPASPLATYRSQLAGFGAGFGQLPITARRQAVSEALTAANLTALPTAPAGQHVAADLMAFWFRSAEATDVCYQRAIRRYDCRGFRTASQAPAPLPGAR